MRNKEKYRKQIIEITMNGDAFAVDKKTNEPVPCPCLSSFCRICLFNKGATCSEARKEWLNQEVEILDEIEKSYLRSIIKPFIEQVMFIRKNNYLSTAQFISIGYYETKNLEPKSHSSIISLPFFAKGTMYKGMEVERKYSVKELGL